MIMIDAARTLSERTPGMTIGGIIGRIYRGWPIKDLTLPKFYRKKRGSSHT